LASFLCLGAHPYCSRCSYDRFLLEGAWGHIPAGVE
jgi:hypothetical protein